MIVAMAEPPPYVSLEEGVAKAHQVVLATPQRVEFQTLADGEVDKRTLKRRYAISAIMVTHFINHFVKQLRKLVTPSSGAIKAQMRKFAMRNLGKMTVGGARRPTARRPPNRHLRVPARS